MRSHYCGEVTSKDLNSDISICGWVHRRRDHGGIIFLDSNEAKVNISDCSTNNVGNSELKTLWKDPDFKKNQNAFYYVRVIENPSCRWSTWDSIRAGEKPRSDIDVTIQERAWSSPIWLKTSSEL